MALCIFAVIVVCNVLELLKMFYQSAEEWRKKIILLVEMLGFAPFLRSWDTKKAHLSIQEGPIFIIVYFLIISFNSFQKEENNMKYNQNLIY